MILAGGKGTRLAPYTTVLPKPLMPIGDRAILDVIVRQLAFHGFTDLVFAVGHLAHLIRAVFGDGSEFGGDTLLVLNGDVLTSLDYAELFEQHGASGSALTVATHPRVLRSEYGVLHVEGHGRLQRVLDYEEKPEIAYTVSMGVYVLEARALSAIPRGERFDIPDLVLALLAAGEPVGSYLYDGYWLDIGRHDDYEQALRDYETILPRLIPE